VAGIRVAASAAIGAADIWLVVVCWRRRAVVGGLCGATTIVLLIVASASGLSASTETDALFGSFLSLTVGTMLFGLGQAVQRLLEHEPEDRA